MKNQPAVLAWKSHQTKYDNSLPIISSESTIGKPPRTPFLPRQERNSNNPLHDIFASHAGNDVLNEKSDDFAQASGINFRIDEIDSFNRSPQQQ